MEEKKDTESETKLKEGNGELKKQSGQSTSGGEGKSKVSPAMIVYLFTALQPQL